MPAHPTALWECVHRVQCKEEEKEEVEEEVGRKKEREQRIWRGDLAQRWRLKCGVAATAL